MAQGGVVRPCEVLCSEDPLCSECMNKVECSKDVWRLYGRLVEDWRRYDALLWQIPFGTMTAIGVILTLAFHYIPSGEHVIKATLFFVLAWFALAMAHLSYKVRHFQIERAACAEAIECKCAKFAIPYGTDGAYKLVLYKEIKNNYERGFYETHSYYLIYPMYAGMISLLLAYAFIESHHAGLIYAAIYACCTTIVLFRYWLVATTKKRGNKDGKEN